MKKIFISYCSKNKKLAEAFIEFLQLGIGVEKGDLFCTMYPETLKTGEGFIEQIRSGLQDCQVVISLVTEEYLESIFCLVEMGAAWAMSKTYFPLLTVPYERLNGTPLQGMEMRRLDQIEAISTVYDELHMCGALNRYQTAEFNRRVPVFVETVKKLEREGAVVWKDETGCCEATIASVRPVRPNMKGEFLCYEICGRVPGLPGEKETVSDWLFYKKNAFPELKKGERVRFRVENSEVRKFPDLGWVRNIYPEKVWGNGQE